MNLPEATVMISDDWRSRGACLAEDPELFFPLSALGPGHAQIAAAKAVCGRCTVRRECLGFAMSTRQEHGIWGGTSEDERRAMLHPQRGPAPRRTAGPGGRRRRERRPERARIS